MSKKTFLCVLAAGAVGIVLSSAVPMACYAAPKGRAVPSPYAAPNMKDAQKQAAENWVLGVLGGDPARVGEVLSIFEQGGRAKASNFLFLRRVCWPASTWTFSQARIKETVPQPMGVRVSVSCPDIEGRIAEQQKKFKGAPSDVARVLAEWRVAYDLSAMEDRDRIGGITISRDAPVNAYGRIFLGDNNLNELLASPERTLTETLKYISAKKLKGTWIRRQITKLKAEVNSSSTVKFGSEFLQALGGVKI